MKTAVNIMCLYWEGDFRKRDFTENDVWRLYHSVLKHADRPFDFYVLTNNMTANVPGTKIELLHGDDWPGWWSKMELHRPDLPAGRTLYLDLDSHIIRNLGPILDYEGDLVMFPTDIALKNQEYGIVSRYQAATMLFTPGAMKDIYDKFLQDDDYWMAHFRSDQDVLGEWLPNQPTFPKEWMMKLKSIERHSRFRQSPPQEVIIITGQPRGGGFRRTHEIEWFEEMAR